EMVPGIAGGVMVEGGGSRGKWWGVAGNEGNEVVESGGKTGGVYSVFKRVL
nr:hypothetical protein [Tanacetum cinerariifolium]